MGKTNKEEKRRIKKERREEKKQRKSFVQEYEEISKSLHKVRFIFIFAITTMLFFISAMYKICIMQSGDAPYNYSEEPYEQIKKVLEGTEEETEEMDEEQFMSCLTEEAGLDIKSFREFVTDYELRSEGENTVLTAWIKNGSFIAEVIITIDKDYHVIDTKRNYNNANEHKDKFYNWLYFGSIALGFILGGIVNIFIWKLIKLTAWIVKRHINKNKLKNTIKEDAIKEDIIRESTNKEETNTV